MKYLLIQLVVLVALLGTAGAQEPDPFVANLLDAMTREPVDGRNDITPELTDFKFALEDGATLLIDDEENLELVWLITYLASIVSQDPVDGARLLDVLQALRDAL